MLPEADLESSNLGNPFKELPYKRSNVLDLNLHIDLRKKLPNIEVAHQDSLREK